MFTKKKSLISPLETTHTHRVKSAFFDKKNEALLISSESQLTRFRYFLGNVGIQNI